MKTVTSDGGKGAPVPDSAAHGADVVISSRVRLARNLQGIAFPGWAGEVERMRVYVKISRLLTETGLLPDPVAVAVAELSPVRREVLRERHLISAELAGGAVASGVVYSRDESMSVMINEEDHLRLQSVCRGLNVRQAWTALERLDAGIERRAAYAWSGTLGYLTACPSNTGTGMRASVMMHLFGLKLAGEIDAVVRGLTRTGFAVRGAYGEGSEAFGGIYQISNQTTLGISEEETLDRIEDMSRTLVALEGHARWRLRFRRPLMLADGVGRSVGLALYARLLSTGEAMDMISGLKIGVEFGMLQGVCTSRLAGLMLGIQAGHLQETAGCVLASEERDAFRAEYIRRVLTGMELKKTL